MENTVAENKKDNASDVDQEGEAAEIKMLLGQPQSLVIKIAIGLVVILSLAAGAYFFFMPEEPVVKEVDEIEMIDEDQLIAPSPQKVTDNTNDNAAENIMELREQALTLREENLQLRERIFQLESTLNSIKSQNNSKSNQRPDAAFINNYNNDATAFPPIITDPPKPKPKPKWGEFERAK